jgi:hypothetical protein
MGLVLNTTNAAANNAKTNRFIIISPTDKGSASVSHTAPSLWTLPSPSSSFDARGQISETRLKIGRLRGFGNQAKDCRQNAPVGIEPHGMKMSPCVLFTGARPHGEFVRTARYNRL